MQDSQRQQYLEHIQEMSIENTNTMSIQSKFISNRETKYSMNPASARPNFESENVSFKTQGLPFKATKPFSAMRVDEGSNLNDDSVAKTSKTKTKELLA